MKCLMETFEMMLSSATGTSLTASQKLKKQGKTKIMADIHISCPNCGAEYDVDESNVGVIAECGVCNKKFEVHAPAPVKSEILAEPPKEPAAQEKPAAEPPKEPAAQEKPAAEPPKEPAAQEKPAAEPPKQPAAQEKPATNPPKHLGQKHVSKTFAMTKKASAPAPVQKTPNPGNTHNQPVKKIAPTKIPFNDHATTPQALNPVICSIIVGIVTTIVTITAVKESTPRQTTKEDLAWGIMSDVLNSRTKGISSSVLKNHPDLTQALPSHTKDAVRNAAKGVAKGAESIVKDASSRAIEEGGAIARETAERALDGAKKEALKQFKSLW